MTQKPSNTTDKQAKKRSMSNAVATAQRVIINTGLLLIVLSIAYSSYTVWFGTDGLAPKVLIAPQIVFAAVILVNKFNK